MHNKFEIYLFKKEIYGGGGGSLLLSQQNFSIFKTNSNFITLEKFYDSSVRINLCEQISDFAGNDGNKSQTVIIVVPIIAFVMLIIISCIYLRVRKPGKKPESKLINWFTVMKLL